MNLREMTKEQLAEESLIDLAYAILEERKSPLLFADLLKEIQSFNGLSDEALQGYLVQFYTDMNIDGRFLLNHENGWGLRIWYKIETIEEETAPTVKVRKKKSKLVEDEEELEDLDEDDIGFEEDFEEFVEDDEEIEEELIDFDTEEIEDIDEEIDEDLIEEDDEFLIDEEEELEEEEEGKIEE